MFFGATTATLTLTAAGTSLRGSRFRCVVTDAAFQEVASNGAVLNMDTPPSPLPKAGDGFPIDALLALLACALAALVYTGTLLRKRRERG